MRILFCGSFNPVFEALPEYLLRALRGAGHEVSSFDHRLRVLPGRVRRRVPSLDRIDAAFTNRRLLRQARGFRPDLLLVNQGAVLTSETIEAIRRDTGAVTVNWWSDYPAEFDEGLALARSGAYDLFYVSGTDAQERHRLGGAHGTRWLPFGCDPFIHHPVDLTAEERHRLASRVVFVGSAYPERRDLLASLCDLGLAVWGPGWERYRGDPKLGACIRGGALRPESWVKAYAAASVVLNVSYGFGGPPGTYGTMANVRVFEAMACGACQVVDVKQDVAALFRDGEHLVLYRSAEEARAQVEALLADEESRRHIARQGRREVLFRHTWRHRLERIRRDIERLAPRKAAGESR